MRLRITTTSDPVQGACLPAGFGLSRSLLCRVKGLFAGAGRVDALPAQG
ncbi:hypothetical protein [Streptomyces sp. ALB3]